MDLYIVPQKGQFEIEVLSDGKKAEVFALEKGIKLLTDQKKVDGKQRLLINGEVISEQGESFVQIRIVSDCENPKEGWKYQVFNRNTATRIYSVRGKKYWERYLSWTIYFDSSFSVCLAIFAEKFKRTEGIDYLWK